MPGPRSSAAFLVALLAAAVLLAPGAAAAPRPWTLDDILSVRTVSDPQISPDGRWIAYTRQELLPDGSDYQTDVWWISSAGGESRRLTASGVADESPRWSPDGRWIAFLSDRPRPGAKAEGADEGRRQLWRIRPDGGEAEPLTNAPGGVSSFEWSRDGRFVAFLSREPKSDEQKLREKNRDDAWTPSERWVWNRLWTIDVTSRQATALTRGDFHVTGFSISPDGRRICVAAQPTPRLPDGFRSDLWMVPVSGGSPTPLVQRTGMDSGPVFSPDGRWIAFESQDGRDAEWWTNTSLCVVPSAGGSPVNLTARFDERPNSGPGMGGGRPAWAPDSRSIVFQSLWRTSTHLFRAFVDGGDPVSLSRGPEVNTSVAVGPDSTLVFVRQDSEHPADLWALDPGARAPRRVTDENPQVRELLTFPKTLVRWKGPGGLDIDGLLISPHGAANGRKAPLVLNVHGGPASAHLNTFSAGSRAYPWPLFVQDGWAVLMPNPRGSGGYGEAFRRANVRDWGGADFQDLMAGVDMLVGLGLADSTRLAVCGWSYGGFMTATIVTKTNRFRAAVVGAGVINVASMAGTCDIPEFNASYFGGWPWEDPQVYVEHSALFGAGRVVTPTALVHGGADERVPTSQAFEFHNALVQRGVPTDLLVLPRQPHNAREPRLQRANMRWHHDWLTRWTLGAPPHAPRARAATKAAEKSTSR